MNQINEIRKHLKNTYGKSNFLGFEYVAYIVSNINLKDNSKKYMKLYDAAALEYNTTSSRVERAIRHYKSSVNIKLTNKEFVTNICIEMGL